GEATQQQLVFDAIRFTPIRGETGSDDEPATQPETSGCAATRNPNASGLVLLALVGFVARRRRSRSTT
ncbi:MAG: MYXO-CTERM sorting domain-containing protein, partial [Kofleriaceae bacterium]